MRNCEHGIDTMEGGCIHCDLKRLELKIQFLTADRDGLLRGRNGYKQLAMELEVCGNCHYYRDLMPDAKSYHCFVYSSIVNSIVPDGHCEHWTQREKEE